jgi:hypothetical protein
MIEEGTRLRVLVFDDDTDTVDSTALLFQMRIARDDLWHAHSVGPSPSAKPVAPFYQKSTHAAQ